MKQILSLKNVFVSLGLFAFIAPGLRAAPQRGTPVDYVLDGNQLVARYRTPGDANASDSVSPHGGPIITNVQLQIIFWGSAWQTATNPSMNDIVAAVRNTISGPYLAEMSQYGYQSINIAGIRQYGVAGISDPGCISFFGQPGICTGTFDSNSVSALVWNLIDNGTFPEPDDPGGRNLYMVFMPPGMTLPPNEVGAHGNAEDIDGPDVDEAWYAWVGNGDLNSMTVTFSHELVESMSDPEPVSPNLASSGYAWLMDRSLNGGNEIGDVCANTGDYLNGVYVQAYWSQRQDACVIPFGPYTAQGLAEPSQAVARTPNNLDTFWVGPDGSVGWGFWNPNAGWTQIPGAVAGPGSASPGTVVATARLSNHMDVFWVGLDGSVWSNWWDVAANNGAWNKPYRIASPGSALPSKLAAVARTPYHLDVFWIAPDGSVWSNWWDDYVKSNDQQFAPFNAPVAITLAGHALPGMIAATAREPEHLDVFWIKPDGSVESSFWDLSVGNWSQTVSIAEPGSALPGAITAVARTTPHLDVFWIAPDESVRTTWWDDSVGRWATPFSIAPAGSAVPGAISAAARIPTHLDVFWVTRYATVFTNWWDQDAPNGNWDQHPQIEASTGGAMPSVISAVGRLPNHLDVFWVSTSGAVSSTWWDLGLNNGFWNSTFAVAGPASASGPRFDVPSVPGSWAESRTPVDEAVFQVISGGAVTVSNLVQDSVPNGTWSLPSDVAPAASAPAGAALTAVSKHQQHTDAFWVNGSIGSTGNGAIQSALSDGFTNTQSVTTILGSNVNPGQEMATVSPHDNHVDLVFASSTGQVLDLNRDTFLNGGNWTLATIAPAGSTQPGAPVATAARHSNHVDAFWVSSTPGSIGAIMVSSREGDSGGWSSPSTAAPAGSAVPGATVTAICRDAFHVDIFWATSKGAVMSTGWDTFANGAQWVAPYVVAPAGSTVPGSTVAATARTAFQVDVFWVFPQLGTPGGVSGAAWNFFTGGWDAPHQVVTVDSVQSGSPLAAVARTADHLDVFFISPGDLVALASKDDFSNGGQWNVATTLMGASVGPGPVSGGGSLHCMVGMVCPK